MRTLLFLWAIPFLTVGQPSGKTTQFQVRGDVKAESVITIQDLKKLNVHSIGDVVITNHLGEKKSEALGLKGVLLREALQAVELQADHPRFFSEFYFTCRAIDGYKVVFSWNELFNSPTGNAVFLVTEKNGKSIDDMEDSILMISPTDFRTGRRYVKALASIEVKRVP